jgi:hypothetical protein
VWAITAHNKKPPVGGFLFENYIPAGRQVVHLKILSIEYSFFCSVLRPAPVLEIAFKQNWGWVFCSSNPS